MKHLKPYNHITESISYNTLTLKSDPSFDPEDVIDALEIEDIKANYITTQHFERLVDLL